MHPSRQVYEKPAGLQSAPPSSRPTQSRSRPVYNAPQNVQSAGKVASGIFQSRSQTGSRPVYDKPFGLNQPQYHTRPITVVQPTPSYQPTPIAIPLYTGNYPQSTSSTVFNVHYGNEASYSPSSSPPPYPPAYSSYPSAPPAESMPSYNPNATYNYDSEPIPRKAEYQYQETYESEQGNFFDKVGYRLYSLAMAVGKVAISGIMVLGVSITGGLTYLGAQATLLTMTISPAITVFPFLATVGMGYTTLKTGSYAFSWFFGAARSLGSSVHGY